MLVINFKDAQALLSTFFCNSRMTTFLGVKIAKKTYLYGSSIQNCCIHDVYTIKNLRFEDSMAVAVKGFSPGSLP